MAAVEAIPNIKTHVLHGIKRATKKGISMYTKKEEFMYISISLVVHTEYQVLSIHY